VETADGRVLNGLIRARTDRTLTLQTQTEAMTIERREIERIAASLSPSCPKGCSTRWRGSGADLLAYLNRLTQAPCPMTPSDIDRPVR